MAVAMKMHAVAPQPPQHMRAEANQHDSDRGFQRPRLEFRRRVHPRRHHHADELFVAEGHNHPRAPLRALLCAHRVDEQAVQRNRQRDFAILSHWRQNLV